MLEYQILTGVGVIETERRIQQYIDLGWKLQGGVSVSHEGYKSHFSQAMIKEVKVQGEE